IVRGGDAQDTGAYVDGQRIPQLYHLLQGPSVLGEDMVDRIDFYPGGAGAYYGRNLAGVVAVTTRKGDAERYHGGASIDLQKSSAYLQGPVDASTQFAVGGRVSYVNPLIKLILPAGTSQAVPVYWDYQGRVDHKLGEHDRLQLTIFGSNDHLDTIGDQRGSVNISDNQQNGFHRARLAWEHGIGDALSLTVAPAIGWDTSGTTLLGQVQAARPQTASSSAFSSGGRIELGWKPARFLDVRGGTDITFDRVSYQQDLLFDEQLRGLGAPNAEQKQVQGLQLFESFAEYLETELRAGPLKLTPGVRVDVVHYTGRTFLRTDPRVWARVGAWTGAAFFGYWGVYHQAPQAAQLDGNTGNPGLLPLRADQVGGGLEQRVNADWSFKIEGWHVWRQNLVFPVAAARLPDGTYSNPLLANSGRGEAYGLELLIRKELTGKVYGWVSYTLSQSRQQARRGEVWEATPFDQPHVFTMLLGLRLSPYVEFASKVRIASGNPLTTLTRVTFNADSGDYVAAQSPLGTDRLPTFVQIDFEVNNVWVSDLFNMQLYVDFQNVLARDNPEALIYDYRYLRTAYVRGTPLSAAVGARVAF
ncbi:MAG: hypothetical protein JST92_25150, partial [Deltaproteobacteria bacterium]|nr:hypothetical protein [Deltaproteobacteria bacterium]